MGTLASFLAAVGAALFAIPVGVLFLEVVAAVTLARQTPPPSANKNARLRLAVLVPAHNESTGLLPTLADIRPQLRAGDRLLVVADNCIDDTASVAAAAGAEVVVRSDLKRIGKGYALQWGLQHLGADPPGIVIVIDADCRVADSAIDRLAATCTLTGRPVQGLDLMTAPDQSGVNRKVAEFAWRVKNWVRPLGLSALKLPCPLMGTGMAFPWEVLSGANLATENITEDIMLGLDLASAGHFAVFCPGAVVTSQFAATAHGVESQRNRWEQGHVSMILEGMPRFLATAIARRNWNLLALTLDMAVPPLSLLAMLVVGMFLIAGLASLLGLAPVALIISTASCLLFFISAVIAWLKFGREVLPARAILSIPAYALGKAGLYRRIFSRRDAARWVRTDRTKS
jgi:cellulose synthase/poly-beta-1,6-N-acetylglucosamine synthase-like glycosyltransferase